LGISPCDRTNHFSWFRQILGLFLDEHASNDVVNLFVMGALDFGSEVVPLWSPQKI
jgi:hypothetical protein